MYLIGLVACAPSASQPAMLTAGGGGTLTMGGAALCQSCAVLLDWSTVTRGDTGGAVDPTSVSSVAVAGVDLPLEDAINASAEGTLSQADITAQRLFVDLTGATALLVEADDWSAVATTGTVALGLTTTEGSLLSRLVESAPDGVDAVDVVDL